MLVLNERIKTEIFSHAELEYPNECCGILLGIRDIRSGEKRIAKRVIRTENRSNSDKAVHFAVDPLELLSAENIAKKNGLEIIGFYHSHPDHEAVISQTDALYMIPGNSYPIVSVINGAAVNFASFEKLTEKSGGLFELSEPIITESEK